MEVATYTHIPPNRPAAGKYYCSLPEFLDLFLKKHVWPDHCSAKQQEKGSGLFLANPLDRTGDWPHVWLRYDIKGSLRHRFADPDESVGKDLNFDQDSTPSGLSGRPKGLGPPARRPFYPFFGENSSLK